MNRILVVTPTLGKSPYIEETIDSVRRLADSTNPDFFLKHVIVSPAPIECFEQVDVIIEPPHVRGMYGAINHALSLYAKDYDYFTYINDDDVICSGFLDSINQIHDQGLDLVYGNVNLIDSDGKTLTKTSVCKLPWSLKGMVSSGVVPFTQQGIICRIRALDEFRFDDQLKFVGDLDLWLRFIVRDSKIAYNSNLVGEFRVLDNQLSAQREEFLAEEKRVFEKYLLENSVLIKCFYLALFKITNIGKYLNRLIQGRTLRGGEYFS